jgi:histidyl-tRNA synthetase
MAKIKTKLTTAQKKAKKQAKLARQQKYTWVFMHGKQVRTKKSSTIAGMDVEAFIAQNADPIYLQQNELWHLIEDVCKYKETEAKQSTVTIC